MKKNIILAICTIIAVILGAWIFQNESENNKEVINIGIVAPVTGSFAAYGSTLVKGVEMAAADISKLDTKYIYRVIVEDDESIPTKSATAASKLINIDRVKAIITTTSSSGNSVKSQAEKARVIHVCDCVDTTIGNVPYNFTNLVLPKDEARAWLEKAQKDGNKTIAILAQVHPGTAALINALLPQVESYGMKVVYNESFVSDTRDFKTIIAKANRTKADIYLLESYPPALDILSRELMNTGVKNISTMGLFTTSPTPNIYNGLWFTDATLTDLNLKERFMKIYPDIRFNARTVPYGYDIFNMLVQSFEKVGDSYTNMKNITEYDGKVGKVTKTVDSQNFRSEASIWIMKNGVPNMVK